MINDGTDLFKLGWEGKQIYRKIFMNLNVSLFRLNFCERFLQGKIFHTYLQFCFSVVMFFPNADFL